jgi:hypothetical protein
MKRIHRYITAVTIVLICTATSCPGPCEYDREHVSFPSITIGSTTTSGTTILNQGDTLKFRIEIPSILVDIDGGSREITPNSIERIYDTSIHFQKKNQLSEYDFFDFNNSIYSEIGDLYSYTGGVAFKLDYIDSNNTWVLEGGIIFQEAGEYRAITGDIELRTIDNTIECPPTFTIPLSIEDQDLDGFAVYTVN